MGPWVVIIIAVRSLPWLVKLLGFIAGAGMPRDHGPRFDGTLHPFRGDGPGPGWERTDYGGWRTTKR